MFELRLGLALGKSLTEIRALPYPEFLEWIAFSQIEPFGWHDREYRTAAQLSMLYNVNAGKGKSKLTSDFIRNMPSLIKKHFDSLREEKEFDLSTASGRKKATERAVEVMKRTFGAKDAR